MIRRSKARECALQIMYDLDISGGDLCRADVERAVAEYWQNFSADNGASRSFTESLLFGICEKLPQIETYIKEASTRWKIDRMAAVDRNILRLGTYELLAGDTPVAVVINEAIELAKKFGAEQSAAFVNGILDETRRGIEEKSVN